ncbi:hypothetical protein [Amycolatopsis sp. NPDC021455]|uniref:hypothetical protein n=1 Tax=Amycolatopsis sp. NPDC021455 TaxID=3154901 RepID=UPI00340B7958
MTVLADLVAGLGAGLVAGRAQADRASVEIAELYRREPLLEGARVPRMVLSEVTVEAKFATVHVEPDRVEVLVTTEELAKLAPDRLGVLTLRYTEADLDLPARPA